MGSRLVRIDLRNSWITGYPEGSLRIGPDKRASIHPPAVPHSRGGLAGLSEPSGELDIDFALAHEDGGANLQKNE